MSTFPATIPALRESWSKVEGLGLEAVGVLFFKRIFEIAPAALALFSFKDETNVLESPKLKAHALKVMQTVATALSMLEDVPSLLPVLEGLGAKHKGYGVLPAHYGIVGQVRRSPPLVNGARSISLCTPARCPCFPHSAQHA